MIYGLSGVVVLLSSSLFEMETGMWSGSGAMSTHAITLVSEINTDYRPVCCEVILQSFRLST